MRVVHSCGIIEQSLNIGSALQTSMNLHQWRECTNFYLARFEWRTDNLPA